MKVTTTGFVEQLNLPDIKMDELVAPTEEEEPNCNMVSIDDMLPHIGEFQRYQWILCVMFCVALCPISPNNLIMYFAAFNPTWQCVNNSSVCTFNGTMPPTNSSRCSLPRSEWEYTEPKGYSIVTYFDIYCGDQWLIELATSILFAGSGIGSLVMGWASDNYGRKNIIFISTAMVIVSAFLTSFMENIYLVISLRFIVGFFMSGAYQSYIILSEIVASSYRPLAVTSLWCFSPIILCLMATVAYVFKSWKMSFQLCSAPYIFVLSFYLFTPESPRWLRVRGKTRELMQTFTNIARFNKKVLPSDIAIRPAHSTELKKYISNPLGLFRRLNIALLTINVGYAGFVNAMLYYAFSLISGELGGSIYLNFILMTLAEIPAGVACIILSDRIGRKTTTIVCVVIAGISSAILAFIDIRVKVTKIAIGMMGKFCISTSYNSVSIWILELYPTTIRSQANGFNNVICTIGATAAPWMVTGLGSLHPSVPYICMCVTAFSCALFLMFLRETKDLPTLECEEDTSSVSGNLDEAPLLQEQEIVDSGGVVIV